MKKVFFYTAVILAITIALTGCLPKTVGQEPPLPVVNIKALLPENTPDDATIYIVGNYCDWGNGWASGDAATSEVKKDNGKKYAEFELEISQFPLEYKYTIGPDWTYVEKGAEGEEIDNRVIESEPEDVIKDTVGSWNAIPTLPVEEPTTVKLKAILPENTPDGATIYIIGSYCGWEFDNAATSEVKVDTENKKYAEFELEISQFPLEYKYTIGPSWDYVEVQSDGSFLENRRIDSAPAGVIEDTVAKWEAIPTPPSEEPTEPPTVGVITLDGDFSDWESYEGAKTIVDDPDDDTGWGIENDVNWLGIAADEQYLYIGAQYKASNNGFIVYISIEGDTAGATDMNFGGWPRAITFNRNVQYFVATWEYGDPQLWQVVDGGTKSLLQEGIQKKFVSQGVGYEVKIPLSVLGLESGNKIYFVGCIVGGDWASSGDTAPDNPPMQDSVNINTIDNMSTFTIP